MKTLDEVIENIIKQSGLEIRNVRKPDRDRFWVDRDTYNDTLQYLRKYREIEDEYQELKDWWAEEYVTNDPLTWDELKAMKGKPVWVEEKPDNEWIGYWNVVKRLDTFDDGSESILFISSGSEYYDEENYGIDWQAYRKEKK